MLKPAPQAKTDYSCKAGPTGPTVSPRYLDSLVSEHVEGKKELGINDLKIAQSYEAQLSDILPSHLS